MKFEWISIRDRLPRKSGMYLVTIRYPELGAKYGYVQTIGWSRLHQQWNNFDNRDRHDDETDAEWNRIITHWMAMPEPAEVEE